MVYARKRFYVGLPGYTGNFFKYCKKSVNYASEYGNSITILHYLMLVRSTKIGTEIEIGLRWRYEEKF